MPILQILGLAREENLEPTTRSHGERVAALKEAERTATTALERALAEAKAAEGRAFEAFRTAINGAQVAARASWEECRAELSERVRRELVPILATFGDSPRAATTQLAAKWRELDDVARDELDAELSPEVLIRALAVSLGREDAEAIETAGIPSTAEIVRALRSGAIPDAQRGLTELEAFVSKAGATPRAIPGACICDLTKTDAVDGSPPLALNLDAGPTIRSMLGQGPSVSRIKRGES